MGCGFSKPASGGAVRCSTALRILIRPATPAVLMVWPMLAFTEPSSGASLAVTPASTSVRPRASTSTGSPTRVAVPWASK